MFGLVVIFLIFLVFLFFLLCLFDLRWHAKENAKRKLNWEKRWGISRKGHYVRVVNSLRWKTVTTEPPKEDDDSEI